MARQKVVICPYCGELQPAEDACRVCQGRFQRADRLTRQNEMGPWFVRDRKAPFHPGMSYESVAAEIQEGRIDRYTILRGPTTKQLWTVAKRVPGISHLVGYCHECGQSVNPKDPQCPHCEAPFGAYLDRNYLGLPDIQLTADDAPSGGHGPRGGRSYATSTAGTFASNTGGSVSSFISDAELVSGPLSDADSDQLRSSVKQPEEIEPALSGRPVQSSRQELSESGYLIDNPESNVRLLTLQKQVRSQQRIVLMLVALLLIVVIVGGLALIFGILPAMQKDTTEPATTSASTPALSTSPMPVTETPSMGDEALLSTPEATQTDQSVATPDSPAQPDVPVAEPQPVPKPADPKPPAEPAEVQVPEAWRAPFKQAQEQYLRARDASIPIDTRIEHAQAAAAALEKGPADDQPIPTPVRSLMEQIAEEIQRLELEKFLGS